MSITAIEALKRGGYVFRCRYCHQRFTRDRTTETVPCICLPFRNDLCHCNHVLVDEPDERATFGKGEA